ncbi:hypothetical protein V6N11_012617 [Hibiscus sabdariffa]|uniref:Uncharacterized protein n=1 Tax=Hibiscus sabdariffa TaxID=183260 RepID=A0ABR2QC45_9ROSI
MTEAESKDKGMGKMSEPTPKSKIAKSVPAISPPTDSMTMFTKLIQNQENILHKLASMEIKNITLYHYLHNRDVALRETLMSLSP